MLILLHTEPSDRFVLLSAVYEQMEVRRDRNEGWNSDLDLLEKMFCQFLRWKKPFIVVANFMSIYFHFRSKFENLFVIEGIVMSDMADSIGITFQTHFSNPFSMMST